MVFQREYAINTNLLFIGCFTIWVENDLLHKSLYVAKSLRICVSAIKYLLQHVFQLPNIGSIFQLYQDSFCQVAIDGQARTVHADNQVPGIVGNNFDFRTLHKPKFVQVLLHGIITVNRRYPAPVPHSQHE